MLLKYRIKPDRIFSFVKYIDPKKEKKDILNEPET